MELREEQRGRLLSTNEALCALLGQPCEALLEMALASVVHPEDAEAVLRELSLMATDDQARWELELRCLHRDGHIIWVLLSAAAVSGGTGRGRYAVVHARDIGERKRFEGELQYLADHDALTSLYNRRRFEEELGAGGGAGRALEDRGAVLMIDLDGFKYVNDSLGHSYGDQLITRVGGLLQGSLRTTDVVARLGGDEFAVILPHVQAAEALTVCEKILEALQGHEIGLSENRHARVTASIGVTSYGGAVRLTAEELMVEADIAMYEAKGNGRNQTSVYERDRDQRTGVVARQSWLERLKTAIGQERFELMAQPIRGICANGVDRYELLLRLRGDDDDLIPPGTFLYIAERLDLIQQIDRWVFAQAVMLLDECNRAGHDVSLSVNMSGKTLNDPVLLDDIEAIVGRRPVRSERLVVEVTETAAIVNIDKARHIAQGLRALGCQFALDDFGAGFASFYYLKHLEFDYLKIDGEFIKALILNPTDQLVVQSVVNIGGASAPRPSRSSSATTPRCSDCGSWAWTTGRATTWDARGRSRKSYPCSCEAMSALTFAAVPRREQECSASLLLPVALGLGAFIAAAHLESAVQAVSSSWALALVLAAVAALVATWTWRLWRGGSVAVAGRSGTVRRAGGAVAGLPDRRAPLRPGPPSPDRAPRRPHRPRRGFAGRPATAPDPAPGVPHEAGPGDRLHRHERLLCHAEHALPGRNLGHRSAASGGARVHALLSPLLSVLLQRALLRQAHPVPPPGAPSASG